MSASSYTFTFPYRLDGHVAAEFEARVEFTVPRPGNMTTDFGDIEIDVGGFVDRVWAKADDNLYEKIARWLIRDDFAQTSMAEIARDDAVNDDYDRAHDEARDRDLMGGDR